MTINYLLLIIQCSDCSMGVGPNCLPCCLPTDTCTSPPPPPGFPIDNYIMVFFFIALFFGAYIIKRQQSKLSV